MAGLKSLMKDTMIYGMSSIVGRFLNYLLVPLYTAKLAVESGGYGIVTEVYSYVALLLVLLTFGMETAFFNCEMPNEKYEDLTEFRFGGRVPDALVIFLGTNDYLDDPWNCEDFAGYYTAFVSRIRGIYPDTAIYLCTALSDNLAKLRVSGIAAAVEAAAAACDNVKVVDIGSWGAEISSDGVHPTEAGYALLTEKFAEYLAAELGISYLQNAE